MSIRRQQHTVREAREWSKTGHLFAILDACDTPAVVEKVIELGEERAVSLYRGSAEEQYESIAPYLVAVDETLFGWIAEKLWSEPWGVFVRTVTSLSTLRSHFRKFLIVDSPNGEKWYFRYYDPRVLPRYVATCTDAEVAAFFGPVEHFAVTDERTYGVLALGISSTTR